MKNAEKFLHYFNEIELWMKNSLELNHHTSFNDMLHKLESNPIVRKHRIDLRQLSELRNAIVHTKKEDFIIAEPHDETVELINSIFKELQNPPKINCSHKIEFVNELDKIEKLLNVINESDYSQLPILNSENQVIEIVSTNTIARWLAAKAGDDLISIQETLIRDLIPYIEYKKNYSFISRNKNYYDAAFEFQSISNKQGYNLDAIFVTDSALKNQKILAMLCISDLAPYFIK